MFLEIWKKRKIRILEHCIAWTKLTHVGPVSIWMRDRLRAGKLIPFRYITSQLGQRSLASLRVSASTAVRAGMSPGWQITLCDPILHMISRIAVRLVANCYTLFTFTFTYTFVCLSIIWIICARCVTILWRQRVWYLRLCCKTFGELKTSTHSIGLQRRRWTRPGEHMRTEAGA